MRSAVPAVIEEREEKGFIHAQLGRRDRQVGVRGAPGTRELADAVDGVVVIEEEQVLPSRLEGIGLAQQLERVGGIGGEDDGVFARIGMKKLEYNGAGSFVQSGRGAGGRTERVRIAKHAAAQQFKVLAELALGVQPASGVVQVDMVQFVQASIFSGPQFVQ